jgi:dethiobiotin synthetase
MTAFFVTSTGTDIGKTFVTRGLIRHFRSQGRSVEAIKPIVSGFDPREADGSDPGLLLAALGRPVRVDEIARVSPWRFAAPLSPHIAARRENREVDFSAILAFCREATTTRADALFIESAGGIMTPIDDRHTMCDLMTGLAIPLVLVAGSYLGTISHTLSALDVLGRRALKVATIVVSQTEDSAVSLDETVGAIAQFSGAVEAIGLPRLRGGSLDHPAFGRIARSLAQLVAGR